MQSAPVTPSQPERSSDGARRRLVGAAAIIALENVVSAYTERWQMVLGITFILIMIFAPEGIIGKLRTILTRKVH